MHDDKFELELFNRIDAYGLFESSSKHSCMRTLIDGMQVSLHTECCVWLSESNMQNIDLIA